MEVIWTRAFVPVLGNEVYAFASLLVVYLVATWTGSRKYRSDLAKGRVPAVGVLVALVAAAAMLPIVLNDPRVVQTPRIGSYVALLSIFPLCAALGDLTPRLIDDTSRGRPRRRGARLRVERDRLHPGLAPSRRTSCCRSWAPPIRSRLRCR